MKRIADSIIYYCIALLLLSGVLLWAYKSREGNLADLADTKSSSAVGQLLKQVGSIDLQAIEHSQPQQELRRRGFLRQYVIARPSESTAPISQVLAEYNFRCSFRLILVDDRFVAKHLFAWLLRMA